ncbi:MAG: ferredoxin-type protein NapF [Gammaproteobacteria bacterium]|nr:ferredoxin-type protein NapF [Gammaproteobacteria bacterium]
MTLSNMRGWTLPVSRRAFLTAGTRRLSLPARPPWSVDEARFVSGCTRCEACITACPERILVRGDGGFPEVDFRRGGCTFCGDCARACPEPLFARPGGGTAPWALRADVGEACLGRAGVVCELCRDACDARALRFVAGRRRLTAPSLDADRCTGCGACVSACPPGALEVTVPSGATARV